MALVSVADQSSGGMQILGKQIAHAAVGIINNNLGSSAINCPADSGVRILSHQLSRAGIFRATRGKLILPDNSADALNVHRDVNLFGGKDAGKQYGENNFPHHGLRPRSRSRPGRPPSPPRSPSRLGARPAGPPRTRPPPPPGG